jgi:hypothetical protein
MKIIHTLSFVLLLHFAWAQSSVRVIKGTTIDNATGTPLPYTSIGIPHKSIGTVSDSSGQFTLTLPPDHPLTDSIVFSHVGYEIQAMRIDGLLRQASTIRLQPSANTLSEVVVKPKITKSKIVGRNGKGLSTFHYNFYTASEKSVDDRLSKEAGMLFELKDKCRINELNFYISGNEFRSLKFRVLFYHVEDGLPTTPMFDRDIIFEIKDGYRGWFKVDLKPYQVWVPDAKGPFAVTIQWLESVKQQANSKYFSITSAKSAFKTFVGRSKAMDTWDVHKQALSFYLQCQCQ